MELVFSLVSCLIVYWLFDNYGSKAGFIFRLLSLALELFITGTLNTILSFSTTNMLIIFGIYFIQALILNIIEFKVYNSTNSFITYFILSAIIEALIILGIGFIFINFFAFNI